jgi:hypothetical protein
MFETLKELYGLSITDFAFATGISVGEVSAAAI